MMTFFSIGLCVAVVAPLYLVLPKKLTGKKYRYVQFVLVDVAIVWLIGLLLRFALPGDMHLDELTATLGVPLSALVHQLYPFKGERNKTISFLLWSFSVVEVIFIGALWALVAIFGMN